MVERVRSKFNHFWFEPSSAYNLGVSRFLFYGFCFSFYLTRDFSGFADVSEVFWSPLWFFERLNLPVFSASTLVVLQACWKIALVCGCVGFFSRTSAAVSFFLGIYLFGLSYCFGKTSHSTALVVWICGILALSRCGDFFSVDQLWRKSRGGDKPIQSGEYTWPTTYS